MKYLLTTSLCGLALIAAASQLNATLIWSADFESYDTSSGATGLIVNNSGHNDTFSEVLPNARMEVTSQQVRSVGVPSFMTGNALYLAGTVTENGVATLNLRQAALPSLGNNGTYVASFDYYNDLPSGYSLIAEARTSNGRPGSTVYLPTGSTQALRITIVINRTAEEILLPSNLGVLSGNSMVLYSYDGTDYSTPYFSNGNITSNAITGFSTGGSRSNLKEGDIIGAWLDNFAVWSSVTDTVNGTSILQLAPGTVIPESSSYALIGGGAIALIIAMRSFRRRR